MLHVHFLPSLTTPAELAGGLVVVIDVLRASTTICQALAAGAKAVVPCLEVDEARQTAGRYPAGQAVLGGERRGLRIDGFDLGNSPSEYTPQAVSGRTLVFTTTNGTAALQQCTQAARVLIGAFVNLSAVCGQVQAALAAGGDAHLLCAGRTGEITGEDVLFAGAIVQQLNELQNVPTASARLWAINDQALLACLAWRQVVQMCDPLSAPALADYLLSRTRGGTDLVRLNLAADVLDAAAIDRFDFVPELQQNQGKLVRPPPRTTLTLSAASASIERT